MRRQKTLIFSHHKIVPVSLEVCQMEFLGELHNTGDLCCLVFRWPVSRGLSACRPSLHVCSVLWKGSAFWKRREDLRCSVWLCTTRLASGKLGLILSYLILRSQVLVKLQPRKIVIDFLRQKKLCQYRISHILVTPSETERNTFWCRSIRYACGPFITCSSVLTTIRGTHLVLLNYSLRNYRVCKLCINMFPLNPRASLCTLLPVHTTLQGRIQILAQLCPTYITSDKSLHLYVPVLLPLN